MSFASSGLSHPNAAYNPEGMYRNSTNTSSTSATATTTTTTTQRPTRPGAYIVYTTDGSILPHGVDPNFFHLQVPSHTIPGESFDFTISGGRFCRATCPPTSRPGDILQIAVLPTVEQQTYYEKLKIAKLTSTNGGSGTVPMNSTTKERNERIMANLSDSFLVKIPDGIHEGMPFVVQIPRNEQRVIVYCPQDAEPGKTIRILLSTVSSCYKVDGYNSNNLSDNDNNQDMISSIKSSTSTTKPSSFSSTSTQQNKYQKFQIVAPIGVQPNQILPVNICGKRVPVQLPSTVKEGQTIEIKIPITELVDSIVELDYEEHDTSLSSGWNRVIRISDFHFQWMHSSNRRKNQESNPATNLSQRSQSIRDIAFVRKLVTLEGNDPRMNTGILSFIPASNAVTESQYQSTPYSKPLVTYATIAYIQTQSLEKKQNWFYNTICPKLMEETTSLYDSTGVEKKIKLIVRRDYLLEDSLHAIISLSSIDLKRKWKIEFLNEPALDYGGVMREWMQLVTEQIFNPDLGLWLPLDSNQTCMRINPACHVSCPDDHLIYFRFLGRVMGRALLDRQLIQGHMVRHLYKHVLGWPITFDDLEAQDEEYYNNLKQFTSLSGEELSNLYLDFTITEEILGNHQTIDLVPDGSQKEVTADNLMQYLEAILRYRMLDRNKPQIQELLLGFFDVIPEPLLTVFDPNELELMLCGLPTIDLDDWQSNTILTGNLKDRPDAQVVKWFWSIVRNDYNQEMRARLLQFATGTSGVPSRGFSVLQGNDGNIKLFTIHGVDRSQYPYPRSHTCFNRIDLPNYETKKELRKKLKAAISMSAVGFDIE